MDHINHGGMNNQVNKSLCDVGIFYWNPPPMALRLLCRHCQRRGAMHRDHAPLRRKSRKKSRTMASVLINPIITKEWDC